MNETARKLAEDLRKEVNNVDQELQGLQDKFAKLKALRLEYIKTIEQLNKIN